MSITIDTPCGAVVLPLTDELLAAARHYAGLELAATIDAVAELPARDAHGLSLEGRNLWQHATNVAALAEVSSDV